MADGARIRLELGGTGATYVVDDGRPEVLLPAFAEFVLETWRLARPWTFESYLSFRGAGSDSVLPGPGQESTRWPELVDHYYQLEFSPAGQVQAEWRERPPGGQVRFTADDREAFLSRMDRPLRDRLQELEEPVSIWTPPLRSAHQWYSQRLDAVKELCRAGAYLGDRASVTELPAAEVTPFAQAAARFAALTRGRPLHRDAGPPDRIAIDPTIAAAVERPQFDWAAPAPRQGPTLVAQLVPARTQLAATDGWGTSSKSGWAARDIELADRIHAMEAGVIGTPLILARPGTTADIIIESCRLDDARTLGYLEHNRIDGSRYWLSRTAPGPADLDAAQTMVADHLQQRLARLTELGWQITELQERPGPLNVDPEQRISAYAWAATADWAAAGLHFHTRAVTESAARATLANGFSNYLRMPVDALVQWWCQAHSLETRGVDAAGEHRKLIERAMYAVDPPLALAYWRRTAVLPPAEALTLACNQFLADIPPGKVNAAVADRLSSLAGLARTGLAELDDVRQALSPQQHLALGTSELDFDLGPLQAPTANIAATLIADQEVARSDVPLTVPPWAGEPDTCWFAVHTGTGMWAAFAQRGESGAWKAHVLATEYEYAHGLGEEHPAIRALDVFGGVTEAAPAEELVGPGAHWGDVTWAVGFDCANAWEASPSHPGRPGLYRDLAFVQGQVAELVVGIEALTEGTSPSVRAVTAWPGRGWTSPPTTVTNQAGQAALEAATRPTTVLAHTSARKQGAPQQAGSAGRGRGRG